MRSLFSLLLAVALLAPGLARADDVAVELVGKALRGQSRPALVLLANRKVASVRATLERPGAKKLSLSGGAVAAGGQLQLPFDAPLGKTHFTGKLAVRFADGGVGELPLDFEVLVKEKVGIDVPASHLRLDRGELDVRLTEAPAKCEYEVTIEDRAPRKGMTQFTNAAAHSWQTIAWTPHGPDDVVLKIRLLCEDTDGFLTPALELYPWRLVIPHEDVQFATGKSEIVEVEAPKLDRAYAEIAKAVRRYGKVVGVKLYVVGHTDTVGDGGSNLALSKSRARAIARYLRKKGVQIPLLVTGLGEDSPLVRTADETDEPRNRRAEYILSSEPPFPASWEKL